MDKRKNEIANVLVLIVGIIMLYGIYKPYFTHKYNGEGSKGSSQLVEGVTASYAAIAFSPSTLAWGSSHGYENKEDAIQDALFRCRESGAKDCEHKTWFYNSCGSLAIEPKNNADGRGGAWGVGRGSTSIIAEKNAMEYCSKYGSNCRVAESICVP